MPKKYKHIRLPEGYISSQAVYEPYKGRDMRKKPVVDSTVQKKVLKSDVVELSSFFKQKEEKVRLPSDKKRGEVKLKFYGRVEPKLVEKYRMQVYRKEGEDVLLAGISDQSFGPGHESDFQRFQKDMLGYISTNNGKSYFGFLENVKPLSLDELLDTNLKEFLDANPDQSVLVDFSFAEHKDMNTEKVSDILSHYESHFISKVNTGCVHFLRLSLKKNQIAEIAESYVGLSQIEFAPTFKIDLSAARPLSSTVSIISPEASKHPVFIIDGPVKTDHMTLNGALKHNAALGGTAYEHGTAVASLAICGADLTLSGDIVQRNNLVAIEVDYSRIEEQINQLVATYSSQYPLLIINLSMNDYGYTIYDRRKVSNLTKLLDELSSDHNCLFVISVGNLINGWAANIRQDCLSRPYPTHFEQPYTNLLPPSDSINGISVGSIVYQESPRSISKIKNPSYITRKNISGNCFTKPDFVHFDGNFIFNNRSELEPEGNGPFLAAPTPNMLTNNCGTSFATPLVTHDLGVLHNEYPHYTSNTLRALLTHFVDDLSSEQISDESLRKSLIGFGQPNLQRSLHSLNTASTIVIEDKIGMNCCKRVRFPVPSCIQGSHRKRLRLKKTLVYNPLINPTDPSQYNKIHLSANFVRPDDVEVGSHTTRGVQSEANKKSNVKKYPSLEFSTTQHTGEFWFIDVNCEVRGVVPAGYEQKYSIIVTIEDIDQDDSIDLHQDISQMIQIGLPIEVNV